MRKFFSVACIFVGAFLVVMAVLAQTYGASQLKKTPLDVDSVTRLSGTATSYLGADTAPFAAKVASTTKADSEKSDDDVVVFESSTCLVKDIGEIGDCVADDDPQARLVNASIENFATDRETALAVNDEKYVPADGPEREGLINKWPFDAEKKDYPFWTTGGVTEAVYDRTEEIDGLETYVYNVEISDAEVELAEGVQGFYTETTEVFVEPTTGQIVKQVREQNRSFADGDPALNVSVEFTEDQVAKNVEDISADADQLKLATGTVPLIGYVVGIPLLLIGLGLALLGRRSRHRGTDQGSRERELADA
ncbi:DUF3068 domain-containing protein [Nocardioides pantholopis]|uniref:DUF3068 domain-containing protein n=1 Tax=Nocardioides pantholopis TaxID=2483798 RepID=UPI000FD6E028|nr:DUF3068 domain-containing protein [Nocardioides pantholopis]